MELSNGKVDEIASNRFIGEPLNVLRDYIHTDVITDKGVTMHTKRWGYSLYFARIVCKVWFEI